MIKEIIVDIINELKYNILSLYIRETIIGITINEAIHIIINPI